ncbi:MAG TPA: tRNA uridine-5-carboxymethylaminomethyl(34) synthesis enzyme MnmG [Exilispira sp.]|nr:tRNA uridine-5-carboxymethylaminomethyl(34) synthesis enzyme MnmG [Spirochaetota bacterium]NLJ05595.1 tRNA uridine-5-carboxymethylaminomethyl(34) synthesis enzyme MnmG [Exilispira sp.]HNV43279.1 tRNA uridine-5-carboxymethylaminomethyl(34) synthesis enzyme MnmG [Exilispira sp.]
MFDIIVCGAGHAGLEASYVASKFDLRIALITMNYDTIAQISCNPSIGGISKGIVVKDLDALGGLMPQISDKAAIQFKKLNTKKGPAMQAIRHQIDKYYYSKLATEFISRIPNITIIQDEITNILLDKNEIKGIETKRGMQYICKSLIITSGTFLNGKIFIGKYSSDNGRLGEFASKDLSGSLKDMGIRLKRFKTGTPARVKKSSINFEKLEKQYGSEKPLFFSIKSYINNEKNLPQLPCYLVHTNEKTKKIIIEHKNDIALYSGMISGIGPRYCPSFEDKVFKFADKEKHQIFIEPEGIDAETMYLNGISTSLAEKYQKDLLQTIEGFENIEIIKPAYAVEYDIIDPVQLKHTLELKNIHNLFFAGQINGTSGYEEAAGQGFVAGLNSALSVMNIEQVTIKREESYIGVMIDDIITKSVDEPYRLFTARAEARLELRNDNAYERLSKFNKNYPLLDKDTKRIIEEQISLKRKILLSKDSTVLFNEKKTTIDKIIKQNVLNFEDFEKLYIHENLFSDFAESIFLEIKYEGYIEHEKQIVERIKNRKNFNIPEDFDFTAIKTLSIETKQRILKYKPKTFYELLNIPGIKPTDLISIEISLRKISRIN